MKIDNNLPNKTEARRITTSAILTGKLKRLPCEVCGEKDTDAHHPDYNKPLEIMFLCKTHHRQWHKENGFPVGVNEKQLVKITRGARMKLKVLAAIEAKTMEEYLEGLIQREDNKRLLTKSRQDYERDLIDQEMSDPKFEDFSGVEGTNNER